MRFTKTFKYNLKRALPILAIGGASMLASCDKHDEPAMPMHDVELKFFQAYYEEIEPSIIQTHVQDKSVRNIYLCVANKGDYTNFETNNLSNLRKYLSERINIAPNKIHGKGNFRFEPNVVSKADSLWFVQQGWTINQHQK